MMKSSRNLTLSKIGILRDGKLLTVNLTISDNFSIILDETWKNYCS